MTSIVLPELGEGITRATVAFWHCKPGDRVEEGEDIVELVTDKAAFNVSATATGNIKAILVGQGQDAKIGEPLAVIEPSP